MTSARSAGTRRRGLVAEYHELKSATALAPDPLLALFERYCARADEAFDAMEWSWKFTPGATLANRVFWLGQGRRAGVTQRSLHWLAAELGCTDALERRGWTTALDAHTARALVAYAGPAGSPRGAVIKIYLALKRCTPEVYARCVRPASRRLPASPPPDCGVVLLSHTIDAAGGIAPRAYVLFNGADVRRPDVTAYLKATAGPRVAAIAGDYPRAGIGVKRDATDMVGLGLRPTGSRGTTMASLMTPVMVPLVHAAARTPLLAARLNRVTWVTLPLNRHGLALPRVPREMNVYVHLRG